MTIAELIAKLEEQKKKEQETYTVIKEFKK